MINELQSITSYGKKQVDKALKKMKELDEEDSDEYNESDYFKLKIYQQKIIDGENELKSLESQIRYGLITLLDIDKDFKIKDKKIKPMPLVEEWDYKSMVEYQMLMELIDISRLNLNLQKNYFTPDIFFWVSWHFKYSNVAPYSSGYDPYHSNIAGAGLGLRWNLDFMQLKANYRIAKIQLLQNENRVELLKKKSSIEDFKIKSEAILLKQKIDVQKNISKESKRWFTGNAMDYYAGIGSSKSLLDSLAEYQKSKISLIRAIYNYNIKISNLKLFRGEK
jgi:hypothetical protein